MVDKRREAIYERVFVEKLFDEMSRTYDRVNNITSFGFSERWRRQCAAKMELAEDTIIYDLMSGMGECWPSLLPAIPRGKILAVDFSTGMLTHARNRKERMRTEQVEIHQADVLANDFPDASAGAIICTFGLKTLTEEQIQALATEVMRLLKPGGSFSFLEISVPPGPLLRGCYLFYLKWVIPILGKLFLGNPDNYRMLGIYTEQFDNCSVTVEAFRARGLEVEAQTYFYGCASGLSGKKPE